MIYKNYFSLLQRQWLHKVFAFTETSRVKKTWFLYNVFSRNGKSKTYVDILLRFFNTEINAQRHLQGIISKGWISGQSVDPNYFKLLSGQSSHTPTATNHKNLYGGTKKIEYSQPLSLHHKPAEGLLHIVHKTPQAINEEVHKKHASPQEQNATSATKQQQPQHVAQALTQPPTTEAPPKQFYLQCMYHKIFGNNEIHC